MGANAEANLKRETAESVESMVALAKKGDPRGLDWLRSYSQPFCEKIAVSYLSQRKTLLPEGINEGWLWVLQALKSYNRKEHGAFLEYCDLQFDDLMVGLAQKGNVKGLDWLEEHTQSTREKLATKYLSYRKDLIPDGLNEAWFGVLDALKTFDASHGTPFKNFCCLHIKGKVIDLLRRNDSLIDCPETHGKDAISLRNRCISMGIEEPDEWELFEAGQIMGFTEDRVRRALESTRSQSMEPIHLDKVDGAHPEVLDEGVWDRLEAQDTFNHIMAVMEKVLTEQERSILELHHGVHGLAMEGAAIARLYNRTRAWGNGAITAIVEKVRVGLRDHDIAAAWAIKSTRLSSPISVDLTQIGTRHDVTADEEPEAEEQPASSVEENLKSIHLLPELTSLPERGLAPKQDSAAAEEPFPSGAKQGQFDLQAA